MSDTVFKFMRYLICGSSCGATLVGKLKSDISEQTCALLVIDLSSPILHVTAKSVKQTDPPTIAISELFSGGPYPVGQEVMHPDVDGYEIHSS